MLVSEPISKIMPESLEYDNTDSEIRMDYFSQMYNNASGIVEIPRAFDMAAEGDPVPDDEYWLQEAAYHAHVALMDALAGLVDILESKVEVG